MPWFVLLQARILGMLPSCAGSTACEAFPRLREWGLQPARGRAWTESMSSWHQSE
jgi:hypothetical protein